MAAAAGDLVGKESELFRFTVKHSFLMLVIICFITLAQAYTFKWIIPVYELLGSAKAVAVPDASRGYTYLLGLGIILIALASVVRVMGRKKYSDELRGQVH